MRECNRRIEYYALTIAFKAENANVELPATLLSYPLPIGPFYVTAFHSPMGTLGLVKDKYRYIYI